MTHDTQDPDLLTWAQYLSNWTLVTTCELSVVICMLKDEWESVQSYTTLKNRCYPFIFTHWDGFCFFWQLVSPFGGVVVLSDSSNELIILDSGELPAGTEIVITNIQPADDIMHLDNELYEAKQVSCTTIRSDILTYRALAFNLCVTKHQLIDTSMSGLWFSLGSHCKSL